MAATTLSADITADDVEIPVVAALSADDGDFLVQIDVEYLLVERRGAGLAPQVRRGMFGTIPVAHDAGDDVTPVQVVVQTDTPTAPPPATGGSPAAIFYSDVDPGAVGTGALWLQDLSAVYGGPATQLWVRNADDDDWAPASPATSVFGDSLAMFTALTDGAEIDMSDSGAISVGAPLGLHIRTSSAAFGGAATTFLMHGTVDPSADAGVDVNDGSLFIRNNAGTRELWFKTGAAPTGWTKIL